MHGNAWQRMATHGNAWQRMATHGNAWQRMATHGNAWQRMATHGNAWQCAGSGEDRCEFPQAVVHEVVHLRYICQQKQPNDNRDPKAQTGPMARNCGQATTSASKVYGKCTLTRAAAEPIS